MKKKLLAVLLFVLVGFAVAQQAGQGILPLAKMTVHVVGEQGEPIPGATVIIHFRAASSSGQKSWAIGKTDDQGSFAAEGHHVDLGLDASVEKEGYYEGGTDVVRFNDLVLGKLQPWNPVTKVVLRPVGKSVALHVKRVQTEIPVLNLPCGYDLEKGDWVAPHGKGTTRDFIFTAHREYRSRKDFDARVELTFANPRDGVVKTSFPEIAKDSVYRWERETPDIGYASLHQISFISREYPSHVDRKTSFRLDKTGQPDGGYFFRVRATEVDGRLISANYGKIPDDIAIDPRDSKTCYVGFTYYLNPTSQDRNLEWNPKKNLITGLKSEEVPLWP